MDNHERRKNGGLSDEQVESIKEAILNSLYEEIGRSLVKKVVWVLGAVLIGVVSLYGIKEIDALKNLVGLR